MDSPPQNDKEEVKARLVDTHSKRVYCLKDYSKVVIVSHSHLSSIDGQDDDDSYQTLIIPSKVDGDKYCIDITVQDDGNTAIIRVLLGGCTVNGESMTHEDKPRRTTSGTFLNIGSSYQLQYLGPSRPSNNTKQGRRVLPQTPGKEFTNTPPSKPRRQSTQPMLLDTASGSGSVGSVEIERPMMDEGLRSQLQRIAKEITARNTGYKDRKPPPPYEQVGNSIAFQLLHQNHAEVNSVLINSLYPSLKAMELKDPSVVDRYNSYLTSYNNARQERATPTCMLPADLPTLVFVTDSLIDLCSFPTLITLIEKNAPLFCQLLAVFSATRQNQLVMSEKRHPSRVLSCMHLGVLSSDTNFQRCGWTVLANTVNTPTVVGKKPALAEPSLTLALSLIERQLDKHGQDLALVVTILRFLAEVATTAKSCVNPPKKKNKSDEEPPLAYTTEQATRILGLIKEYNILRHIMKVPEELRNDQSFNTDYCALVKALVPTRQQRSSTSQSSVPQVGDESTPTPSKPPRKPQRTHRFRRSSSLGARELAKKSRKQRTRQLPTVPTTSNTSTSPVDKKIQMTQSGMETSTQSKDNIVNSLASSIGTQSLGSVNDGIDDVDDGESPLLHSQSCSALMDGTQRSEEDDDLLPQTLSEPDILQQEAVDSEISVSQDQESNSIALVEHHDQESVDSKQQNSNEDEKSSSAEATAGGLEQESTNLQQNTNQIPKVTSGSETQDQNVHDSQLVTTNGVNDTKIESESTIPSLESEPKKPIEDDIHTSHDDKDAPGIIKTNSFEINEPSLELSNQTTDSSQQSTDTDLVTKEENNTEPSTESSVATTNVLTTVSTDEGQSTTNITGVSQTNQDDNEVDDEIKAVPNLVLETTDEQMESNHAATGDEWKTPPPTPRTASLARDVQSLLESLRAPLAADGVEQIVRVPSVSRNNHYYRHSLKKRNVVRQEENNETNQEVLSPSRMQWGEGTHPSSKTMAQLENCSPFEVSGQFLSTTHAALEDIKSGHSDMIVTLHGRMELLDNVLELWKNDKGLQAATNTLHGCFSDGSADIPLFTDLLQCFMKHPTSWTIAVCVVLLPALRQLATTQTDERHLETVCAALEMIVKRFSDIILTCKSSPTSSRRTRFSAAVDRQQIEICYRELHATRVMLHNRLDLNFDPTTVSNNLRKVHALLKPYREELSTWC